MHGPSHVPLKILAANPGRKLNQALNYTEYPSGTRLVGRLLGKTAG
jgi:hypothetical protein